MGTAPKMAQLKNGSNNIEIYICADHKNSSKKTKINLLVYRAFFVTLLCNKKIMIMEQKAIIYARVSSTNDRQNCERQIADLNNYATANNIIVDGVFTEHISGATRNDEREGLKTAIDYAKNEGISLILFSELSRLGRSTFEVMSSLKYFADNKINCFFQKENITLLDKNGEVLPMTTMLLCAMSITAQFERENIKFRLNSGRELAKQKGVKMGRKNGSIETIEDKEKKYPTALKYIRKGYKNSEVLAMAIAKGEKISLATIKRLKKGE